MSVNRKPAEGYGIGAVARLTGLTDHTIRVWERRYGAVVANRLDNGRRVYSEEDVEKLNLLKQLTDRGLSIGQIAGATLAELRDRSQAMDDVGTRPLPEEIRIAILGDFLPVQIFRHNRQIAPLVVQITDSNPVQFGVDLSRQRIDFVVVESAVLDEAAIEQLNGFVAAARARGGMIVYKFGKSQDVDRAKDCGLITARSPIDVDQWRSLLLRAATENTRYASDRRAPRNDAVDDAVDDAWPAADDIPRRRFTPAQLARLTKIESAVDCECPQHLASLVTSLAAFEIYSAQCANRDEDDAALHRYLHRTTADARARVEEALDRVITFEDIEL